MIVNESDKLYRFLITQRFLEFMADNRIETRYGKGPPFWKVGDEVTAARLMELQPHVTMTASKHLVNLGCFSLRAIPAPVISAPRGQAA